MKYRSARRHSGGVFTAVMLLALSIFFTGGCGGGSDDHAMIARDYISARAGKDWRST